MKKTCLKCKVTSELTSLDALTACPSCGAIYAKVEKNAAALELREKRIKEDREKQAKEKAKREQRAIEKLENSRVSTNNKLMACDACNAQISKQAKACPHCGQKVKRTHPFTMALAIILAIGFIGALFSDPQPRPPLSPEQQRYERIAQHFSPWDGSHRNLEQKLKQSLNDPDSYEHIETHYWDEGDHLIVNMQYRATNRFGAKVKGSIKAKTSLDGQVLGIIESR